MSQQNEYVYVYIFIEENQQEEQLPARTSTHRKTDETDYQVHQVKVQSSFQNWVSTIESVELMSGAVVSSSYKEVHDGDILCISYYFIRYAVVI